MKHLILPYLLIFLLLLDSCSPKISTTISKKYTPLDYRKEVIVFGLKQQEPKQAEVIGKVKIGDSGFTTDCDYETVINEAKMKAREIGGNAIKIILHKQLSAFGSSCHRIVANILRIEGIEAYAETEQEEILLNVDYSIFKIYRYSGPGSLVAFDLKIGDSTICRVRNNFKTTLHIYKEGTHRLRAKTESASEIPIDLKPGKTYFIRCSIAMGAFVGRPKLELVDYKTGKAEFESFKAKHQ